jgi:hypothetical protein
MRLAMSCRARIASLACLAGSYGGLSFGAVGPSCRWCEVTDPEVPFWSSLDTPWSRSDGGALEASAPASDDPVSVSDDPVSVSDGAARVSDDLVSVSDGAALTGVSWWGAAGAGVDRTGLGAFVRTGGGSWRWTGAATGGAATTDGGGCAGMRCAGRETTVGTSSTTKCMTVTTPTLTSNVPVAANRGRR